MRMSFAWGCVLWTNELPKNTCRVEDLWKIINYQSYENFQNVTKQNVLQNLNLWFCEAPIKDDESNVVRKSNFQLGHYFHLVRVVTVNSL